MRIRSDTPSGTVNRWWILVLAYLAMLAFALNLQMIPPMLPKLVSGIGLTHTGAGVLMSLFTLPGIFLAIPGGRVSDLMGPRNVALWSLALLAAGTFMMLPVHPWFLFAGRLCAGLGAAVIVVVSPQIIARSFHGRELGMAMGIYNTAVPLGTIMSFNLLGYLSGRFGIPVVITATASFTFFSLAAFYLTYADPVPGPSGAALSAKKGIRGLGPGIWMVSLVWALFNISILAYFTYAIDFFIDEGMNGSVARFLSSMPMLLSIFLTPLAGFAMHRYGLRWSLPLIGCTISAAAIYLILFSDPAMTVVWTVMLGAGISMVPPAVFTIAGEVVPSSWVGTGFGILTTVFNLGIFVGIPLVGHARDLTQTYSSSFMIMSVVMLLGALTTGISRQMLTK